MIPAQTQIGVKLLTDCATKPLPTATKVSSLLVEKDFPAELVGLVWVFFVVWYFGDLFAYIFSFLFASHSCPC